MEKIFLTIAVVLTAIVSVSCDNICDDYSKDGIETIIEASMIDTVNHQTKTAISEKVDGVVKYTWLAGDAINVFFGASESSIFVTNTTARVAQFKGTIGAVTGGGDDLPSDTSLWGAYPYNRNTTCDGSSIIITLPHEQESKVDDLADDLFPSIARSTNFQMAFYPVCGCISFKVAGSDIVKVTLSGNENEMLAGKAKVSMELGGKPCVEEVVEGQTVLSMSAPNGGCFEPGKSYYFVFYPSDFEKGLTLTYYKKDSHASFSYPNPYPIGRNVFGSISAKDGSLTFVKTDGVHYIDEYGVNHGPGVEIDGVVWAPVNCGYHVTDYPYGKLYQWGRKYGQGYDSNDASVPSIVRGPEDFYTVTEESNSNKFYTSMNLDFDWIYGGSKSYLWNSGTEENPIKTEYDPCPDGWRVPTYIELDALKANYSSLTTSNGQNGYWFSGSKSYSESVNSIFLSAAGERLCGDGSAGGRGNYGRYWSSSPYYNDTYYLKLGLNVLDYFHRASGFSVRCVKDSNALEEEDDIKVQKIYMLTESATLAPGTSYNLYTDYEPIDATNTTWEWSSSDASVAYVDDSGNVTAIADGEATITATATDGSGVSASSTISVVAITAIASAEYKDEYGVNHGRGIAIGDVVWAPVNCGYKAPTVDAQGNVTDKGYPYGKLYQWGRKYGQGFSLEYDSTAPSVEDGTLVSGPIENSEGQLESNADVFYFATYESRDWVSDYNSDELWNSGTEYKPEKTEYDPCPDGWRVPTEKELTTLSYNFSEFTSDKGQNGRWFSGIYIYQNCVPKVFFSAAADRDCGVGTIGPRGQIGYYWCSRPNRTEAYRLRFNSYGVIVNSYYRADGYSIRCVQE